MLQLGALAFASPWVLLGLAALPAIWWLLRISPPLPKRVRFPAIRLLVGLAHEEETPAHTPLWLLLLRLVLAAVVVFAIADPMWNPAPRVAGSGPLLIVVDNGWTSATRWRDRVNAMDALIADARRNDRTVLVVGTAPSPSSSGMVFKSPDDAAAQARALRPEPYATDRMALLQRLEAAAPIPTDGVQTIWLSDGIDNGKASDFSAGLSKLAGNRGLEVVEPRASDLALALLPPSVEGDEFVASVIRADATAPATGAVRALEADGGLLGEAPFKFEIGERKATAKFDLPIELRNRVSRLEIAGETSAGAVSLIDERWRRRTVGLVSGAPIEEAQPLLSDLYYLQRALDPFAEIRHAAADRGAKSEIADLLSKPLSVLVLSDLGNLIGSDHNAIASWIDQGGVLLRFAGPHLAGASDDLVPVPLRTGGRALGGALSWTNPQHLAPFEAGSPFYGLATPDDVTVSQQVLAEPTLDLAAHTWARLADGTPLVTATRRGKGMIVLFHVTANSEWSNLPLSGLFVDMLRRVIGLSQGVAAEDNDATDVTLAPVHTLDGFGRLGIPPATATSLPAANVDDTPAGPHHPPGLYGPADAPRAFNLGRDGLKLEPIGSLAGGASRHPFAETRETRLRPLALALAVALIIADGIAALYVTGLFDTTPIRRRGRRMMAPALLLAIGGLALLHPLPARAADDADAFALKATTDTHLAYVITGDRTVDDVSEAGLRGLTEVLRQRTSFEPGDAMGVDIAHDELSFFPVLYWPMTSGQENLSAETLTRIDLYMKNGGTILFDTRDQDRSVGGLPGPGTETLRRLLGRLDLPPLQPVPESHVLRKSFYILQSFPGRMDGGQIWIETSNGGSANDGVSPILVGSNDYAAAWARDANGRPMFPCQPGGEMQREMAERFGVNLVMYALTGNYKSDQVHVPALLERMGR
ncbi:DUF4159 domain-containing protein [Parvibaculum sedimenti]|uniref:DUF4159 domain-containing protein n=2 Tax=Parvibaculum sedimenti TaxID=2608632 RepID=A0A6N6VKK5_9HYPH|nr:DUF4159 domain-containing protein [Parvibaculum sedimenti]KAB7739475.1 DUF4159 domain-containing protein [Parvibaculum sedimenti]